MWGKKCPFRWGSLARCIIRVRKYWKNLYLFWITLVILNITQACKMWEFFLVDSVMNIIEGVTWITFIHFRHNVYREYSVFLKCPYSSHYWCFEFSIRFTFQAGKLEKWISEHLPWAPDNFSEYHNRHIDNFFRLQTSLTIKSIDTTKKKQYL